MSVYEFCVDMGSNFTTIYKKNLGVVLREPTTALVSSNGRSLKVLKVGLLAQKNIGKTSGNEFFVNPVSEGIIKNIELTKKILTEFFSKVVNYRLVKPAIKLIVLIPVALKKEEYEDYKKVFYGIGFAKIDFVYNVLACSLIDLGNYNLGKASLLINIGASKTEIATINNGKILDACSLNLGGNTVDKFIVQKLSSSKNYSITTNSAKKIKEEIGSLYETDKSSMEVFVYDKNINSQCSKIIYAHDLIKPIYECYFKILQVIQAFFNSCSNEIAQDIKNDGIILYGGASQISGLEKFFKNILNMTVFVLDNPETVALMSCEKLFNDNELLEKIVDEN